MKRFIVVFGDSHDRVNSSITIDAEYVEYIEDGTLAVFKDYVDGCASSGSLIVAIVPVFSTLFITSNRQVVSRFDVSLVRNGV